jgi:hypothetical protein
MEWHLAVSPKNNMARTITSDGKIMETVLGC